MRLARLKQNKIASKNSTLYTIKTDMRNNYQLYIMAIPMILFFIIFKYLPMYGVITAFQEYVPSKGIFGSEWVGLQHFKNFFNSYYFVRVLKNTLLISFYNLIWSFPLPIIFALLLNEVRKALKFKKVVQTLTYIPYFISLVVLGGLIVEFTATDGFINDLLALIGIERQNYLMNSEYFRTIFVTSGLWKHLGWDSIIFLAALTAIDTSLYEAATIDGAGRFKQVLHVTIPGIFPTITILLILKIGKLMNVGWQKILLLYNPITYETADVINTFVYRKGILEQNYGYSAAVGLFNAVINLILIFAANRIAKKISDTSLW